MKKLLLYGCGSFAVLVTAAIVLVTVNNPTEPEIEDVVRERVNGSHYGLVVGTVDQLGQQIVSHGVMDSGNPQQVGGDTLFELCSVTKLMTALLLAVMVERGEVALDDPISRYLPSAVSCPEKNRAQITLLHLAAHSSGLPSRPFRAGGQQSPSTAEVNRPGYVTLSESELYRFLSSYELSREPGSDFEYSNLGMGLLGHILALRAGVSYEQLVIDRICTPLGMTHTRIALPPELRASLAPGHFRNGEPARHWMLSEPLVGAGALRSTANDMLKLLAANLGLIDTPLARAIEMTHQIRLDSGSGFSIGLGWGLLEWDGHQIWLHSGGVPGYRSLVAFSKQQRKGVVVLGNSSTDIEDVGLYLLDRSLGLAQVGAAAIKEPVEVDARLFDSYAGHYRVDQRTMIAVSKESGRLFLQVTRQPRFELLPEAEGRFFIAQPAAQVELVMEGSQVSELVLSQGGRSFHCRRLPPVTTTPLGEAVAESYAGCYRIDDTRSIMVTRDGNRLFVQPTMRPREELFTRSATELFAPISDTEVSIVIDLEGKVSGLVLRQGRDEVSASKVEEQVTTVDLSSEALAQLTGLYRHSPDFDLTVTLVGDRLFIQGTNQPMHQLYPRSDSRFFLKTVPPPGEVSIQRDHSGRVTSLTVFAGRETETSRKIR